jgi:hypothetical protein
MKLRTFFAIILTLACVLGTTGCKHSPSAGSSPVENQTASQGNTELIPAAVLINGNLETALTLIGSDQKYIGNVYIDNAKNISSGEAIPVGRYSSEEDDIPLVYSAYSTGVNIMLHKDDQNQVLRQLESLSNIAGSNGQSAVAFADVAYSDSGLKSSLYVANVDQLGLSTSVYQITDALQQWALAPVAVEVKDNQPGGVWYTTSGWGVGGPGIIFPITQGLYYYDIQTGNNTEYLSRDESLQGLSPDHHLAGSIASSSYSDHAMKVTNLESHWSLQFPLQASSDQGSGFAVFSPDDQYIAWLEAGTSSYDQNQYNYMVRVGNLTDGKVIFEINSGVVEQTLRQSDVSYLQPVGWLDDNSLLIEARGENWEDVNVVRLDLADQKVYQFAIGAFVNFVY